MTRPGQLMKVGSFSLVHVIGKFGVAIEFKFVDIVATFLDEKTKDVNWLSWGVHLDFGI